jgi:hypothetical protein
MSRNPPARELLENPEAFLSTSHLAELGLSRRAIEAVLRELDTYHLPGYSRPLIRVEDFLNLRDRSRFSDDRVRPM